MPKVAGKKGLVVSQRPSEYEMTEQQKLFKEVLKRCGIKKGMSKKDLQEAMVNCIPEEWAKIKREREESS